MKDAKFGSDQYAEWAYNTEGFYFSTATSMPSLTDRITYRDHI